MFHSARMDCCCGRTLYLQFDVTIAKVPSLFASIRFLVAQFYVAEFNIVLINERIRFITRGTRRSVLSDLGGPAKNASSSAAATPDSKGAAEPANEAVVDSIVCFIRYSHFEWFYSSLVDLFPGATLCGVALCIFYFACHFRLTDRRIVKCCIASLFMPCRRRLPSLAREIILVVSR
jgi:hypothetical protein